MKTARWMISGFVVGLLLALSPGCSGAIKPCDASVCPNGCCDAKGECQLGALNTACGARGAACVACLGNQVCSVGFCVASGGGGGGGGGDGGSDAGDADGGGNSDGGSDGGVTCGPTSCAGCCIANTCLAVNLQNTAACGNNGQACSACGPSQTCTAGSCQGGSTCTTVNFTGTASTGGFDSQAYATAGILGSSATFPNSQITLLYFHGTSTPPLSRTFSSSSDFQTCDICPFYGEQCTTAMFSSCAKLYFAQGGSAMVASASASNPGSFQGSISNIKFVEWDLNSDTAVDGGSCVNIASANISASW